MAMTKNRSPVRAMRLGLLNPQSRHGTSSLSPRSRAAVLERAAAAAVLTAHGLPSASAAGAASAVLLSLPAAGFWGRAFLVMSIRTVPRQPLELVEALPGLVLAVFRAAVALARTGAPTDAPEPGPRQNSSGEWLLAMGRQVGFRHALHCQPMQMLNLQRDQSRWGTASRFSRCKICGSVIPDAAACQIQMILASRAGG